MSNTQRRWLTLFAATAAILMVFIIRTIMARAGTPPRLFDIFDTAISLASLGVVVVGWRTLSRTNWLISVGAGLLVAILLPLATLYSPYPFLEIVTDVRVRAVINGVMIVVTTLGGLVIMHWGGPITLQFASMGWRRAVRSLLFGVAVGLPFAILNGFANAWTQNRPITWQNPLAAAIDALHPAVLEEVIYRFAFLGLLWLLFRRDWPNRHAVVLSGLLALLTHTYSHYSELFVTQPLTALAMGAVMGLIWGIPPTLLAVRRDLESALSFHWIQDVIRFWLGF